MVEVLTHTLRSGVSCSRNEIRTAHLKSLAGGPCSFRARPARLYSRARTRTRGRNQQLVHARRIWGRASYTKCSDTNKPARRAIVNISTRRGAAKRDIAAARERLNYALARSIGRIAENFVMQESRRRISTDFRPCCFTQPSHGLGLR